MGALTEQRIRELWPPEVAQRAFVDYLRGQYDHTQLGAIEVCCSGGSCFHSPPMWWLSDVCPAITRLCNAWSYGAIVWSSWQKLTSE